jgi:hypothetical protein
MKEINADVAFNNQLGEKLWAKASAPVKQVTGPADRETTILATLQKPPPPIPTTRGAFSSFNKPGRSFSSGTMDRLLVSIVL